MDSIKDRPGKRILEHALSTGICAPRRGSQRVEFRQHEDRPCPGLPLPRPAPHLCRGPEDHWAEINLVSEPHPGMGQFLQRIQELLRVVPGAFSPNQYADPRNSASHHHSTMHEATTAKGQLCVWADEHLRHSAQLWRVRPRPWIRPAKVHAPRRAAGENRLALHRLATADDAIEIADVHAFIDQGGA